LRGGEIQKISNRWKKWALVLGWFGEWNGVYHFILRRRMGRQANVEESPSSQWMRSGYAGAGSSDDEKREEELSFPLCCRWLWVFFEAARGGLRLSFLLLCWGAAFSVNVVTCASSLGAVVGWHGEISFLLYYTRKMITVDFFLNKLHK
jgi:hypothetical protein